MGGTEYFASCCFLQFHKGSLEFVREHWEVLLLLVMDSRRLGRIGEAPGLHQH